MRASMSDSVCVDSRGEEPRLHRSLHDLFDHRGRLAGPRGITRAAAPPSPDRYPGWVFAARCQRHRR